jgi:hypothetical protein
LSFDFFKIFLPFPKQFQPTMYIDMGRYDGKWYLIDTQGVTLFVSRSKLLTAVVGKLLKPPVLLHTQDLG